MLHLDLEPYRAERLHPHDAARLQALFERCSDYHEMEEGIPTRPGAAEHLLTSLPPGSEPTDKLVLGIHSPAGELVGVLDLIRDRPSAGEWWLGLLMLEPSARGRGLGARVCRALATAVAGCGARAVSLGVLEQNAPAERFWRRQGFEEVRRQPYTSAAGQRSRVIVLRHTLVRSPVDAGGR